MTTSTGVSSPTTTYGPVGTVGTQDSTTTSPSEDTNAINEDMFLKLLVAQLRYQDPNNAVDPSTFLSQSAQFTTVEKLSSLEKLSQKVFDSGRQQLAAAMLGCTVTYTDVIGQQRTGTVTGVSVGATTPNLTVDGIQVSLDSVSAVTSPATPTPSG
jgi:flagellar basal-body rod modification protein FlgD